MALNHNSQSADILLRYKRGVFMEDEGYLNSESELADEGAALIRKSLKELDALGPNARDALIPLLDDSSVAVRAWTAAALVKIMPERTLAILHDICDRSLSDSRMTACHFLTLYEQGRLNL